MVFRLRKEGFTAWCMLGVSLFALVRSSQFWIPSILTISLWGLFLAIRTPQLLRKWWLYTAVLPFGIWFLLAPTADVPRMGGISLWAIWIPAWYFALLGCAQIFTLGRGGEVRFVWWNSAAILALSGFESDWIYIVFVCVWTFLWCIDLRNEAVGKGHIIPLRTWLWWGGVLGLSLALAWGWAHMENRFWKFGADRAMQRGMRGQMRGFEPASWLGSFKSEYESSFESQTVLRVFAAEEPTFMRIIVHSTYSQGVWRSLGQPLVLRPERNILEYSVFHFGNDPGILPGIWVQQAIATGGFLPLPSDAGAVAIVADSLLASSSGVLRVFGPLASSGYYVFRSGFVDASRAEEYLQVPPRLSGLLDSMWLQVPSGSLDPQRRMERLQAWFATTFRYTLQPRLIHGEDPLRTFFHDRAGYCEYFGTAATLLLRNVGIPARYVTGFAYPEHTGNAWVFRRTNAHGWVEVLLPGKGWVTFDPTPPTALPGRGAGWRTLQNLQEYLQSHLSIALHMIRDGAWKLRVDAWSAALQRISTSFWPWATLAFLIGVFAIVRRIRRRKQLMQSSLSGRGRLWANRLHQAEKRLARQGFVRAPYETVADYLLRLGPEADEHARSMLFEYQRERFRADPGRKLSLRA